MQLANITAISREGQAGRGTFQPLDQRQVLEDAASSIAQAMGNPASGGQNIPTTCGGMGIPASGGTHLPTRGRSSRGPSS